MSFSSNGNIHRKNFCRAKVLFSRIIKILLCVQILFFLLFWNVKIVVLLCVYWNFCSNFISSICKRRPFSMQIFGITSSQCQNAAELTNPTIHHCMIQRFILYVIQCQMKWDLFPLRLSFFLTLNLGFGLRLSASAFTKSPMSVAVETFFFISHNKCK